MEDTLSPSMPKQVLLEIMLDCVYNSFRLLTLYTSYFTSRGGTYDASCRHMLKLHIVIGSRVDVLYHVDAVRLKLRRTVWCSVQS